MRQYANSPIIQKLVSFYKEYFNAEGLVEKFYNKIWNLDTASSYGLDIWGRIVGIGRYLTIDANYEAFGFDTSDLAWKPFDQAPFFPDEVSTKTYRLADDAYRKLILAKAMANIYGRSSQVINRMCQLLFEERGNAFALDLGNMRMRYVFRFPLEPYEKAIVNSEKVFARPAGVKAEIKILPTYLFGFDGQGQNFDNGIFYDEE